MTAVRCSPALSRSVAAADHGAAVGGGAAGQGVVELEVDVVKEVTVGPSLIIFTSHRHKGEYRFCLTRRDGVQIILAQIHTFAA